MTKRFWLFIGKNNLIISYGLNIFAILIGIILWVYPFDQNPSLRVNWKDYDLVTMSEPNNELQILVNGKDIRKENLNLKIYSFEFSNTGKSDIFPSAYDSVSPLRIELENCTIIGCYEITVPIGVKDVLLYYEDSSTVFLRPNLLKSGEREEIKILVLHNNDILPVAKVEGRIANTNILVNESLSLDRNTFLMFSTVGLAIICIFLGGFIVLMLKKRSKTSELKNNSN